jgi:hypothetical protein
MDIYDHIIYYILYILYFFLIAPGPEIKKIGTAIFTQISAAAIFTQFLSRMAGTAGHLGVRAGMGVFVV